MKLMTGDLDTVRHFIAWVIYMERILEMMDEPGTRDELARVKGAYFGLYAQN